MCRQILDIKCHRRRAESLGGTIPLEGKDINRGEPEQVCARALHRAETRDVFPDLTVAENLMLGDYIIAATKLATATTSRS